MVVFVLGNERFELHYENNSYGFQNFTTTPFEKNSHWVLSLAKPISWRERYSDCIQPW
jgi:hypothetical protein